MNQCGHCGFITTDDKAFIAHVLRHDARPATHAANRTSMDILPVAINKYRCMRCTLTLDGYADMMEHYKDHHAPNAVVCTACLADITPGPGQRLDIAFGKIAQHFDSHHGPKAQQQAVKWSLNMPAPVDQLHSAAFRTIEQEFFELAAMRGGSILDLAIDLIEEYVVSRNSDWLEVLIHVKDQMVERAKECADEKRDIILGVAANTPDDIPPF